MIESRGLDPHISRGVPARTEKEVWGIKWEP